MATAHLRTPERVVPADDDGVIASFGRLAQLEFELGLAETRRIVTHAAVAIAVAVVAAAASIAAVVVLIAAAFAPLFGAPWQHLVIAGAGVLLAAVVALALSAWRLKTLEWPRLTLQSLAENWRWLEAQMRSRLTLR